MIYRDPFLLRYDEDFRSSWCHVFLLLCQPRICLAHWNQWLMPLAPSSVVLISFPDVLLLHGSDWFVLALGLDFPRCSSVGSARVAVKTRVLMWWCPRTTPLNFLNKLPCLQAFSKLSANICLVGQQCRIRKSLDSVRCFTRNIVCLCILIFGWQM